MALPCVRRREALWVHFFLFSLLSFVFVRHVRATVYTNIKYDRVALKRLKESSQNGLLTLVCWTPSLAQKMWQAGRRRGGAGRRIRRMVSRGRLTLPVILFANVQSLENKMDELHARISKQRYVQDCSMLCFCETWLGDKTPDESITPEGYMVYRANCNAVDCGKTRGGGTAIFVNQSWCTDSKVISQYCCETIVWSNEIF